MVVERKEMFDGFNGDGLMLLQSICVIHVISHLYVIN